MAIHEWWGNDPSQIFWMETTGRSDLGANLLAPQEDEGGNPNNPGYVLVTYVQDGDIVLHWNTHTKSLIAWSRAVGGYWSDRITWASVPGGGEPYDRPAWVHGLDGPYFFDTAIPQADLQRIGPDIGVVHAALQESFGDPLYFPFIKYGGTWKRLRAGQPYMSKFPSELVPRIPRLGSYLPSDNTHREAVERPKREEQTSTIGLTYIEAPENVTPTSRDPYEVDPSVVERGITGHARTQNLLADWARQHGYEPLRPSPLDLPFDLAWRVGDTMFLAEVKSLTPSNEERQLRLGLGQVLRYRHLASKGFRAEAVLVSERQPSDPSWVSLCESLGVHLAWPPGFESLTAAMKGKRQ